MIKRYPVVSYFAITYLITWPFHILGFMFAARAGVALSNEDNFRHFSDLLTLNTTWDRLVPFVIYSLGQVGPVLAAFLVTALIYGRSGLGDLSERVLRWRLIPRWYLTVLLLPLLLIVVSLGVAFVADGFKLGPFSPKLSWTSFVPFLLFMIVFTGLAEEPGWRGFALPHLQAKHSAYRASWILGMLWGVWHFPFIVYFNLAQPWLLIPSLLGLTFGIVGWTLVNTWVYNNTESVLLMILLHGWGNTVHSYLILSQPNLLAPTLYSLLPWAIAFFLGRRFGNENLGAAPRPKWWPDRYDIEQRRETGRSVISGGDSVDP